MTTKIIQQRTKLTKRTEETPS